MCARLGADQLADEFVELVRAAGFDVWYLQGDAYIQSSDATYMLSLIELGADSLVKQGRITPEFGAALKAEACHRVDAGIFFGEIVYASLLARKPATSAR
jgi:hypothetical protein